MKHLEQHIRIRFAELIPEELAARFMPAPQSLPLLVKYLETLSIWTNRVDLVTPGTPEELLEQHVLDCLSARAFLFAELGESFSAAILDIGTGAGLPGMVWACVEPERMFYLCEPREKRVVFLKEMRALLGLKNVEILRMRMEQIQAADVPGLGLITTRALGLRDLFVSCGSGLLPDGGRLAFLTGESFEEPELEGVGRVSFSRNINYLSSAVDKDRKIVLLNVSRET